MSVKNKPRPIVFCIDKNYSQHLAVALESLYTNNSASLDVHIFHSTLDEVNILKLKTIGKKYNRKISFHPIDKTMFRGYKENFHFTIAMYFRLLIPDLLSQEYESAIYIDSDVVINGNISYLLEVNISNKILAAVTNPDGSDAIKRLGMDETKMYFDSGLLIFNLNYWRKNKFHHKVLQYIQEYPDHLLYPDNDALNILINGEYMELNPMYSLQSNYIKNEQIDLNYYSKFGDITTMLHHPIVIQFAGGHKPWHYLSQDYYKDFYFKYLRQSPYSDFKYKDKTIKKMILKNIIWPIKKIIAGKKI